MYYVVIANYSTIYEIIIYIYICFCRQDEFEDAYITSRPVRIFEFWKTFESHYIHDSSKFISWYESFLTVCKELVQTEANNLTVLFGSEAMPRLLGGLLETSFASIAVQVAERVHLSRNPVVAVKTFQLTNEFASTAAVYLDGLDPHRLFCVMSAMFGGFVVFMDQFADMEGEYLKIAFNNIIGSIVWEEEESLFGNNTNSNNSINHTTSSSSSLSLLAPFSLANCSDPVEACSSFAEKIVIGADECFAPTTGGLQRAVQSFVKVCVWCYEFIHSVVNRESRRIASSFWSFG